MERELKKKLKGGGFANVPKKRSDAMRAVRSKGNRSTEVPLRMALVRAGVAGWVMHPKRIEGSPDFLFPKEKVAVFVDGCFWHGCPKCGHIPKTNRAFWKAKIGRNKERDRKKRRILRRSGFVVLKFWEHQIRKNTEMCVRKVLFSISG